MERPNRPTGAGDVQRTNEADVLATDMDAISRGRQRIPGDHWTPRLTVPTPPTPLLPVGDLRRSNAGWSTRDNNPRPAVEGEGREAVPAPHYVRHVGHYRIGGRFIQHEGEGEGGGIRAGIYSFEAVPEEDSPGNGREG